VRVPATSSNLGAGFDALGIALRIANTLTVRTSDSMSVEIVGEGADDLPRDAQNMIVRTFASVFDDAGVAMPVVRFKCDQEIPPARGLGSSAAAAIAALMAADAVLGRPSDTERLLTRAVAIEGHADNAAPAIHGGLQACVRVDERHVAHGHMPLRDPPRVVLFIPALRMTTAAARAVLPALVSREDAVFNISRTALLLTALATGRDDLLDEATRDAIHQTPRTAMFPALPKLFHAAREAGAVGVWLSGAGSTVAAFARPDRCDSVSRALASAGEEAGVAGRVVVTDIDPDGASVEVG